MFPAANELVREWHGLSLLGGQLQRIGSATTRHQNPGVPVLDEATSLLEMLADRALMENVLARDEQQIVTFAADRISIVEHCDCVVPLEQGCRNADGRAACMMRAFRARNC